MCGIQFFFGMESNDELVRCLLDLACLSVNHISMLKKCIYFSLLIYSYHVAMRTCMLHLSSVVVVGFFSTIIFCFIMHMFFTHLNTCVTLRVYPLENM